MRKERQNLKRLVIKVKQSKRLFVLIILILICVLLAGCWNYSEIEQLAIIAGVAIDKNPDGSIHITIEIADIASDGKVSYKPVILEVDGQTVVEAMKKGVILEGKRLYWSHAKVIILSQEIAKEDISKYLDYIYRDEETRVDVWMLVSKEKTAGEILKSKGQLKPIVSFQIDDIMRTQKEVSRFPRVEIFEFFDRTFYTNVSPILPAVKLSTQKSGATTDIEGTAIFRDRKLVGFLDARDTKLALWLRDEIEGGLIPIRNVAGTSEDVVLEIIKSKSKITPVLEDGHFVIKVDIEMRVNIGEITGTVDFIGKEGRGQLKEYAEKEIKKAIEEMYKRVRDEYDADIFGFGRRIDMHMPAIWNQIKNEWNKIFLETELQVTVDLDIEGSSSIKTPLKVGD